MRFTKQLFYSLGVSIIFLMIHILILYFKLSEVLTLVMVLGAMVLTQLLAFRLLRRDFSGTQIPFKAIFYLLCMTQTFSILLLSVQAAFDSTTNSKPLNPIEIITSLVIFAVVLPLIITSGIWLTTINKRT